MSKTDKMLAKEIGEAAATLNSAIVRAVEAGLKVEIDIQSARQVQDRYDRPMIVPSVEQPNSLL